MQIFLRAKGEVTALHTRSLTPLVWRFLYAPGAGSNLEDPFGRFAATALAEKGIETIRFQFPYMEADRRAPDRTDLLETTWRAVLEKFRSPEVRLAAGGRSMGGRIASQVVAAGETVEALVLLAYPLHPPSRPEKRRDGHLANVSAPTLFLSGTRDAFGTPQELTEAAALVPGADTHLLEGADHGFQVLKSSGRRREQVWEEASEALASWLIQPHRHQ